MPVLILILVLIFAGSATPWGQWIVGGQIRQFSGHRLGASKLLHHGSIFAICSPAHSSPSYSSPSSSCCCSCDTIVVVVVVVVSAAATAATAVAVVSPASLFAGVLRMPW